MNLHHLPITDAASARAFARSCVDHIGRGYHPDTPFADYVDHTGKPVFTPEDAVRLESLTDTAFSYCGDRFYALAARRQRQLFSVCK